MDSAVMAPPPPPPPPPAPSSGGGGLAPPPPPPPPPGSAGAMKIPSYREELEQRQAQMRQQQQQADQYTNLPPQLMNTMSKDKKPFTYTPLAVGDKGKLDLSQIRSPRMKKRLLANMMEGEDDNNNKQPTVNPNSQPQKLTPPALERRAFTPDAMGYSSLNDIETSRALTPDQIPMSNNIGNSCDFNNNYLPTAVPVSQGKQSFNAPKLDFTKELMTRASNQSPSQRQQQQTTVQRQHSSNQPQQPLSPVEFEAVVNEQLEGLNTALQTISRSPEIRSMPYGQTSPAYAGSRQATPSSSPATTSPFAFVNNYTNATPVTLNSSPTPYFNPMATANTGHTHAQYNNTNNANYGRHSPAIPSPLVTSSSPSGNTAVANNDSRGSPVMVKQGPRTYYSVPPPKKIDLLKEGHEQDVYSTPTKNIGPSLQEQWAAQKQGQSPSPQPVKIVQQPPRFYGEPETDEERSEPIQSRSFRVLQKLTEGIQDELDNLKLAEQQTQQELQRQRQIEQQQRAAAQHHHQQQQQQQQQPQPHEWTPQWRRTPSVESPQPRNSGSPFNQEFVDPRYRGSAIPSNSFRYLQDMVGLTNEDALESSMAHPNYSPQIQHQRSSSSPASSQPTLIQSSIHSTQQQTNRRQVRTEIEIPIIRESEMVPPSQQTPMKSPPQYSGSSIPSRSFRMLQMMTGEEPATVHRPY